jgi:hypothetical protein
MHKLGLEAKESANRIQHTLAARVLQRDKKHIYDSMMRNGEARHITAHGLYLHPLLEPSALQETVLDLGILPFDGGILRSMQFDSREQLETQHNSCGMVPQQIGLQCTEG